MGQASSTTRRPPMPSRYNGQLNENEWPPKNMANLLLVGGWRTAEQLHHMSDDDKRHAITCQLRNKTANTWSDIDQMCTAAMVAAGSLYLVAARNGWRSEKQMLSMEIEDIRNTCIVELHCKGYGSISQLQALYNIELAEKACDFFNKYEVPDKLVDMHWKLDQTRIGEKEPLVLKSETFDNSKCGEKARKTFTWDEEVQEREGTTVSTEHSWFVNVSVKFEAEFSIPMFVKSGGSITVSGGYGSKEVRTLTKETIKRKKFSDSTSLDISPYKCVQVELVVTKATATVPFEMVVETKSGQRKTIIGEFYTVLAYDVQVKTKSIKPGTGQTETVPPAPIKQPAIQPSSVAPKIVTAPTIKPSTPATTKPTVTPSTKPTTTKPSVPPSTKPQPTVKPSHQPTTVPPTVKPPATTKSPFERSNAAGGRRLLKSRHNTYLCGREDGVKVKMSSSHGHWEKWDVQCNAAGELWLKGQHPAGRFLRGHPDGKVDLSSKLEGWEKWKSYKHGDGSWSFKNAHGQWLSARGDGSVCSVGNCGAEERFTLENW